VIKYGLNLTLYIYCVVFMYLQYTIYIFNFVLMFCLNIGLSHFFYDEILREINESSSHAR
jgi:hypothetical protein